MGNKAGKLITRVLYIAFALIIIFFSSIIFFNTAKGDHIINLTNQYLAEKNYDKIQELFGGVYYNKASVYKESDKGTLLVAASGAEKDLIYMPEGSDKEHLYHKFNKAYNFFIFDASFGMTTVSTNDVKTNDTAVKFITDKTNESGEAVTYSFPFVISTTVNSNSYKSSYTSVSDYFLNFTRDYISDRTKYGFFNFQITEETLNSIKSTTGGNIVGFNITDNEGKNVFENNFDFAFGFDELFYNDNQAGVIFNAYNRYIPYYDSYKFGSKYVVDGYVETSETLYNTETTTFNKAVDDFAAAVKAGGTYDENVKISLSESEIMTGDVIGHAVWRTIGIEALILLVIVVIYILLFHFQQLRSFLFRNDKRTPIRPKIVNKEPEQQEGKFAYDQTGKSKNKAKDDNKVIDAKTKEEENK